MPHLPGMFEGNWYQKAAKIVETVMRNLLKTAASQQGSMLQVEICELIHRQCSDQTESRNSVVQKPTFRHQRTAGSALMLLVPKKKYPVKLKSSSEYDPNQEARIEKDCCATLVGPDVVLSSCSLLSGLLCLLT